MTPISLSAEVSLRWRWPFFNFCISPGPAQRVFHKFYSFFFPQVLFGPLTDQDHDQGPLGANYLPLRFREIISNYDILRFMHLGGTEGEREGENRFWQNPATAGCRCCCYCCCCCCLLLLPPWTARISGDRTMGAQWLTAVPRPEVLAEKKKRIKFEPCIILGRGQCHEHGIIISYFDLLFCLLFGNTFSFQFTVFGDGAIIFGKCPSIPSCRLAILPHPSRSFLLFVQCGFCLRFLASELW